MSASLNRSCTGLADIQTRAARAAKPQDPEERGFDDHRRAEIQAEHLAVGPLVDHWRSSEFLESFFYPSPVACPLQERLEKVVTEIEEPEGDSWCQRPDHSSGCARSPAAGWGGRESFIDASRGRLTEPLAFPSR